jgi:hypothetical protein
MPKTVSMNRPIRSAARRLGRVEPFVAWYALGWGLFLTSGLVGLVARAVYLLPVLWVVFGLVQLELGYRLGHSALPACLIPVGLAIAFGASTSASASDDVVAALLLFPVMPVGAALSGIGIWLRCRSRAIVPGDIVYIDAKGYEGYATARGLCDGELVFTPLVTIWDPASVALSRISWHGARSGRRSQERT